MDYLTLGPTPAEESCAQVGDEDYRGKALAEIRRYLVLLRRWGPEAEAWGCAFFVKSETHDFGTYHEAAIRFDNGDEAAAEYAYFVENHAPGRWDDNAVLTYREAMDEPV